MTPHPPLEPLVKLLDDLRSDEVEAVLGGSGLLYALGLVDVVNDWDITTESDVARVETSLLSHGYRAERLPPSETAASKALFRLCLGDANIDVIVGFAAIIDGSTTAITSDKWGEWMGIPLADPSEWRKAYAALQRMDRVRLLDAWRSHQ